MFANYLGCIEAVASFDGQASAGQVQRMNAHMTLWQVKRALDNLVGEGYLDKEKRARGNTGVWIYMPTNRCDQNIRIVSQKVENVMGEVR